MQDTILKQNMTVSQKKNNRDDFSQKTINSLRRRAGNRCSNPECRVPTDAPSDEGSEKVNSIGEAAHITAAAPGPGARRYNKALESEERQSITNGIWLCANCADKIDKDEETYTVALLHEWKKKAEESAKREQGKKLPDEQDAINTLVAAATGQTSVFLPNLMPNASKAASGYIEKLDPRFTVKTNFYNGETHHFLHPKEPIDVKLTVKTEKFKELIKHGSCVSFDSSEVKIEGLPSLEINENSKIYLGCSCKRTILVRIKTISPDLKSEVSFYDLHGDEVSGTESATIKAEGLGGLFLIKIGIFFDRESGLAKVEYRITVNYKIWDGRELNKMQYFDQIYDLYYKINNNWILTVSVESEGRILFSTCSEKCAENSSFSTQFIYLDFIRMARDISRKLKYQLCYNSLFELTDDIYSEVKIIHKVLSDGSSVIPYNKSLCIKQMEVNSDSIILYNNQEKSIYFRVDQSEHGKIKLFDKELPLPKLSETFTDVKTKVINNQYEKINIGDLVDIELIPSDNSKCIIEKIPDSRNDE
ncbi:MAG: hypothetical protein CDV28_1656 [Candidatus Electronema aureum]|uniref:Uncharacterized protein n=1 Tax=Candidatus Electronema aureum TaxID=2005002 RepID=A0A521FY96_9BACT|nr:MAG: hypothetical protein CDV28_1656 [Candidatus Electronema aureum]